MRKVLVAVAACASLVLAGCASSGDSKNSDETGGDSKSGFQVTDVANRQVSLEKSPERIVLGQSRTAFSTMFLNKEDPLDKIVAWAGDLEKNAPDAYKHLVEKFPKAEKMPTIGAMQKGDLSVEEVVKHKPDLMIISLDQYKTGKSNGITDQLDKADVAYMVVDFRVNPLENTTKSVELLGAAFDQEENAKKFIDYYNDKTESVISTAQKAAKGGEKPNTFLWRAAGLKTCCATFAESNLAEFITETGGTNLADGKISGEEGELSPEQILKDQPEQVFATGGTWADQEPADDVEVSFVPLGYDTDEKTAQKGLKQLLKQPGFSELQAGKNQGLHAIYHQFYDSPYNFVAVEAFAKWQHPDKFADLDPNEEFKKFHKQFMPFQSDGTFAVSITE
jgi:iron complex transport system substrate-binding protein